MNKYYRVLFLDYFTEYYYEKQSEFKINHHL